MRCGSCEKMVSYGEPEAEVQSEEVNDDGQVQVGVRLALPCADCGGELKDNEFELEQELEHTCEASEVLCTCRHTSEKHDENKKCKEEGCLCEEFTEEEPGFELSLDDPEPTEDYRPKETTSKKGVVKPVPMRYQKHYFGVHITGTATCNRCGEEISIDMSDDEQSSGFNEC